MSKRSSWIMTEKAQTVDSLLEMTPIVDNHDNVRLAARHLFLGQIKGQSCVRDVFFPTYRPDGRYSDACDAALTWFKFTGLRRLVRLSGRV